MILNPNGCDLSRLSHRCRVALWLVSSLMGVEGENAVVTHTFDGEHMQGSLHFKNRAFDILPPLVHAEGLERQLRLAMGKDYDLVVHADHWHFEHDPK